MDCLVQHPASSKVVKGAIEVLNLSHGQGWSQMTECGGNKRGDAMKPGILAGISVLILDDNRQMRTVVKAILSGLGIGAVHQAATVAEAFSIVRARPVDIIFCDWMLNPGSGIDFVRHLRCSPDSPNPYLPVVMMSAYADRARIEQARDAGGTEFLVKPLSVHGVIARLEEIIERPRPFVRSPGYFGPDRRRRVDPAYAGPERRRNAFDESEGRPAGHGDDTEIVLI